MNSKLTLGAAGALLALIASSASAAVIVDYKMTASGQALNSTLSLTPTSADANVVATGLVNQAGAATTGSNNYNTGTDRVSIWSTAAGTATVSYAAAFTAGSYVTFSVTAPTGYEIDLDSISFQAAAATNTAAAKRSFYLVSELSTGTFTNSSTVLVSDSTPQAGAGGLTLPLQSATATNTVPKDYSVSLASLDLISQGQTRIFRFYLQTETSSQSIAFDDIVLNGTVSAISAVPEPSSFAALAGLGALGFVAVRRRRA